VNIEKLRSNLRQDPWLQSLLLQLAGHRHPWVHPWITERLEQWAEKSVHHIAFQPWEDWRLDVSKNTLQWKELGPQLSGDIIWQVTLVRKYYIFGRLADEKPFEYGPLEIDEEYWGNPTLELSQGKNTVRQAIEIWSRNFLGIDKKVFKVDAVVRVTIAQVLNFSKEYAIDVFRPEEPFVLPQAEWTGIGGTLK
jgi:hypothetical protein